MTRYILGSEKLFYNFVNSISKNDKIGVVTHIDLDGIASGIFLQKILESRDLKINFMEFLDYNADTLKPILKKDVDVLFFTDWNVDNFPKDLEKLRKKYNLFVVDHHPPNKNLKDKTNIIKTHSKYCSAHTLFDLAKDGAYFDIKGLEWLACSAIIMDYTFDDKENLNFLKSFYPKITLENIWESEPALIGKKIANSLIYYKTDLNKVYDLVLNKNFERLEETDRIITDIITEEVTLWKDKFMNEAEYFPKKKLYFYYGNPKYLINSTVVTEIANSELHEHTLIFASDYTNTKKKDLVKISARNDTGKVDLGNILKKCIKGFKDSSAGGHVKSAAGTFPKKYLDKFKERVISEI